jgi:hypothetical protein
MKVFLVPLGPAAHVPYSEPSEQTVIAGDAGERGMFATLAQRFREVIAAAERTRHERPPAHGWIPRLKRRALGWLADRIAEQRLLWHLRTCERATLVFPSDLDQQHALDLLRQELKRDGDWHLRWLVIDGLLLVASGVLALVPGPNVIAYYFAFQTVGHYLSWRGARHGLQRVDWSFEQSPDLHDLRGALHLEPEARHVRLHDIARRLELAHLTNFVERVAFKGA